MNIKCLVFSVVFIAVWQVGKTFVVKVDESVANLTQPVHVVIHSVSTNDNSSSSTSVVVGNHSVPEQFNEDEKTRMWHIKSNDSDLNVEIYEEEVSVSLTDLKEDMRPPVHVGKDVDNVKSSVKNHEKEGKNEKAPMLCRDSDDDEKSCRDKQPPHEEEEEEEAEEDDGATNKDDHENDD